MYTNYLIYTEQNDTYILNDFFNSEKKQVYQYIKNYQDDIMFVKMNMNNIDILDSKIKKFKLSTFSGTKYFNKYKKHYNNNNESYQKMISYEPNKLKILFENIQNYNLNILVSGIFCYLSVLNNKLYYIKFTDLCYKIELHIKEINNEKIKKLDEIINTIYEKILFIQQSNVITWIIYNDNKILLEIKLNLMLIKSWSEAFVLFNCTNFCIGYDILNKYYVFHERLKYNFCYNSNSYLFDPNDVNNIDINYYNNILSNYKMKIRLLINNKYNNININNIFNYNVSIIKYLKLYYNYTEIIHFDINFDSLSTNNIFLPYLYVNEALCGIEQNDCLECPVLIIKTNIIVVNTKCQHYVSLKAFVINNIIACPICRTKYGKSFICLSKDYEMYKNNFVINNDDNDNDYDINKCEKLNIIKKNKFKKNKPFIQFFISNNGTYFNNNYYDNQIGDNNNNEIIDNEMIDDNNEIIDNEVIEIIYKSTIET